MTIALQALAIAVCGLAGGAAGWWVTRALGWGGTGGAILAAIVGMIVATLVWVAGVAVQGALARPPRDAEAPPASPSRHNED